MGIQRNGLSLGRIRLRVCFGAAVFLGLISTSGRAIAQDDPPEPPELLESALIANSGGGNAIKGSPGGVVAAAADGFSGASTSEIPLTLPPGTKSPVQGLSINYNSRRGNGIFGIGWALELPSITIVAGRRASASSAQYSFNGGSDSADLVVTTIPGEYRARVERTFARFYRVEPNGQRPFWEMRTQQGVRFVFGKSEGAQVPGSDGKATAWLLESVVDALGNTMSVTYERDGANTLPLPKLIKFESNSVAVTPRSIRFEYENRSDSVTGSIPGASASTSKRVSLIKTDVGGALYDTFWIRYEDRPFSVASASVSLLRSVDLLTSVPGAGWFRIASFNYGDANPSLESGEFGGSQPILIGDSLSDCVSGNFDGDGRINLLCYRAAAWRLLSISSSGISEKALQGAAVLPTDISIRRDCIAGDFHGNGKSSLACHSNSKGWHVLTLSGDQIALANWAGPQLSGQCLILDLNDDARLDFACQDVSSDGRWQVSVSTGASWSTNDWPGGPRGGLTVPTPGHILSHRFDPYAQAYCLTGDFNGDRLGDVACYRNIQQKWEVGYSTGSGWRTSEVAGPIPQDANLGPTKCTSFDLNSDGRADIACAAASRVWSVSPSMGATPVAWNNGPAKTFSDDCLIGDVNGDGRVDFLCNTEKRQHWNLSLNTGAAWNTQTIDWIDLGGVSVKRRCFSRDSGYQSSQFVCSRTDGVIERIESSARFPSLLAKVTGTLGATTAFEYDSSTTTDNPQMPAMPVVVRVKVENGNGIVATSQLTYGQGKFHAPSRSFRGFAIVQTRKEANENVAGSFVRRRFYQGGMNADGSDDPNAVVAYLGGRERSREIFDASGIAVSRQEFNYRRVTSAPYFSPLEKIETFVCGAKCNLVQRDEFEVLNGGEVVGELRSFYGPSAPAARRIKREFVNSPDGVLKGFVSRESVKSANGGKILSETRFFYDGGNSCQAGTGAVQPAKGMLTRISRSRTSGAPADTEFGFDGAGNLTCTRDARGNLSTFSIDPATGFVMSSTNAVGHTTKYEYYGASPAAAEWFGQVKTVIGPDGIRVESTYDQLRRLSQVKTNGSAAMKSFEYLDIGDPAQRLIERDSTGTITTRFNGDGNPTSVTSTMDSSHEVVQTQEWLPGSLRIASSLPFFAGSEPAASTSFTYDSGGRLVGIKHPDGRDDTVCYFGATEFVVHDGLVRSVVTRSPAGDILQLSSVADLAVKQCSDLSTYVADDFSFQPGSHLAITRKLSRDELGRIIRVVDNGQETARATYDLLGRTSSTFDVNRGLTERAFDEAGNVILEKDATGRVTSTTYDSIDRASEVSIISPRGSKKIVLKYDDGGPRSIGKLTKVESGGTTETISYDDFGRPAILGTHAAGLSLLVTKEFDDAGRVSRLTYPDGMVTKYNYDGLLLHSIEVDDKQFAAFESPTPTGSYQLAKFGNGLTREISYSSPANADCPTPGFRLCATKLSRGSDLISSRTLYFARAGELERIEERGLRNSSDKFYYDGFGRLRAHAYKLSTSATWRDDKLPEADFSKAAAGQAPAEYRAFEPEAAWDAAYSVDLWGNIVWSIPTGKFEYPARNAPHRDAVSGYLGSDISYDAAGRATTIGSARVSYDPMGKFSGLSTGTETSEFEYGGSESLVSYRIGTGSAKIMVGGLAECVSATQCRNSIFASQELLGFREAGKTVFLHRDHLGSTREVSDEAGVLIASFNYGVYGSVRIASGPEQAKYVGFVGGQALVGGKYYKLGPRLYSTEVGRFMSTDPITDWNMSVSAGNPYAYAFGDPMYFADPDGEFAWAIVAAAALIGGIQAARHGDNVLEGALRGAVFGVFVASGYGLVAASGATGVGAGYIMANAGAWGGIAQASIWGGDPSAAAQGGAISALGGYLLGGMKIGVFGESKLGGTANYVATASARGAAMSAAYAVATGRDVQESAMSGAKSGAVEAMLASAAHHSVGYVVSGKGPEWDQKRQVFRYEIDETKWPSWHGFSLGNVVTANNKLDDPLLFGNGDTLDHEAAHTWEQSTALGPVQGYLGSHAIAILVSLGLSYPGCGEFSQCTHKNNFLEKEGGWISHSYEH